MLFGRFWPVTSCPAAMKMAWRTRRSRRVRGSKTGAPDFCYLSVTTRPKSIELAHHWWAHRFDVDARCLGFTDGSYRGRPSQITGKKFPIR